MRIHKIFTIAALCASGIIGITSCSKSSNDDYVDPRIEKIRKALTQKDWVIDSYNVVRTGKPDSSILVPCMADDVLKIAGDGKYDLQEGAIKCDIKVFPYGKGEWGYNLMTDSMIYKAIDPVKKITWKVETLNDDTMVGTYKDATDKFNKKIVFKHPKIDPKANQ